MMPAFRGFKDGEAYYAAALHFYTTTNMSPQEIHNLASTRARRSARGSTEMLKAQGMTKGTVGERIAALNKDPTHLYPNTDAGKAEAIAYCNERLDAVRPKLPAVFKRLPPYTFEVRRVPCDRGRRRMRLQPAAVARRHRGRASSISTCTTPRSGRTSTLATTVFHEGLPGHQLEGGLALSNKGLPLIRKTTSFSGYAEGWGALCRTARR